MFLFVSTRGSIAYFKLRLAVRLKMPFQDFGKVACVNQPTDALLFSCFSRRGLLVRVERVICQHVPLWQDTRRLW